MADVSVALTTPSLALARGIQGAANAFLFFSADIAGKDWLHRPCPGAGCTAWIAGHLILSARGMMKAMGVADAIATDAALQLPEGFEKRFARDESAPKSSDFGDTSILHGLFKLHHDALVAGVAKLSTEKLAERLAKPTPMFGTIGELAAFAPTHIGMHTGQISTIRRSLGRPPMI